MNKLLIVMLIIFITSCSSIGRNRCSVATESIVDTVKDEMSQVKVSLTCEI